MEKRYEHLHEEKKVQEKWQAEQTYNRSKHPGKLFSVDTPPPTVSGSLHIGHIFSYTQTDIIARYKRMDGFSVFYPFGFDDNGLPTERYVEKKLEVAPHQVGRSKFIDLCLEVTHEVEQQFADLWQRMGISANWQETYSTISASTRKISQESFIRLYKKGFVYRKFEPALYCTTCRTSVAQAELDDMEKPSHFNDIIFKATDGQELIIGTTRPELLPSCVAVFYHPNDARYQALKGKKAVVPLFGLEVPIMPDELVNPEKGTGLVMCCAFGDKTDIMWIKKHNLPQNLSLGHDGKWLEHTGPLAGLKVHDARKKVLELLNEQGLLKAQKAITHAVNVHERCKKEIEYITLSQWFLKILEYKQKFLDLADTINWHPAYMKSRYKNWVENISWDWCLSRQRFYGIPFPVWHCLKCNEILLPDIKDLPIDPQETTYPGKTCSACGSSDIKPDTDVMDTWNTSSLTPYICYGVYDKKMVSAFEDPGIKEFLPMSMRPQAHDIIRTWAFYTIIKAWMHHDTIPWRDIVISGHVLSDGKEKLSKSKEQKKIAPEHLLQTFPADAIRYWTASASLGQDVAFSETQLKIGQKLLTKLWNAFIFISSHIQEYKAPAQVPAQLGLMNEWLLHQASTTFATYKKYLDAYEFNLALDTAEKFFWHDFCDNYLEIIKDQLFNPGSYSAQEIEGTRYTLFTVGLRILQLYAPYIPHITEAIFQEVYKDSLQTSSVHETKFAAVQKKIENIASAELGQKIIDLVAQVRKLKSEQQLSLKTDLALLTISCTDKKICDSLAKEQALLQGITRAQALKFTEKKVDKETLTQEGELYKAYVVV
ncbi:MAG: valine--tRNA ligase [Candidatus Babeliales bacterium]